MACLGVYFAGHLRNSVAEINQRKACCPSSCHVQGQGMSDAAGSSGDHRDLPFNLVHIDSAGGPRFKGANFICVEAPSLGFNSVASRAPEAERVVQRLHVLIPGFGQHSQRSALHLAHLVEDQRAGRKLRPDAGHADEGVRPELPDRGNLVEVSVNVIAHWGICRSIGEVG
jgi:hypothetical protein